MITEAIDQEPVRKVKMRTYRHPTTVTNEAFGVLSNVNKPPDGFESLSLELIRNDMKLN